MLLPVENLLYKVRDLFWRYPDFLFGKENSLFSVFSKTYSHSRPFSHIAATVFVTVLTLSFMTQDIAGALRINRHDYIEGIVTGVDPETGRLVTVSKINPLIQSSVQLERDLNEIIYEPLINMSPQGMVHKVLAEDVDEVKRGEEYVFTLKQNVFWHDGSKFTAEDVVQTYRLLKQLNSEAATQSAFSRAASKLEVKKVNDYTVVFKTLDGGIIPNFYEVTSSKILPAAYLSELNEDNITTDKPKINRNPIGTGPFKFESSRSDELTLNRFVSYHESEPKLRSIKFVYFVDEDSALMALRSGEIHGLAGLTVNSVQSTNGLPHLQQLKSSTLYTQYWGIYFNLREEGPVSIKDQKVRQAIAYALNKNKILELLENNGEIAGGPIPKSSFAYRGDIAAHEFDIAKASDLLTSAGWVGKPRAKGEDVLRLTLTYVDNVDRNKIAESIKQDLAEVGIEVELNPLTLKKVNEDYILPRRFELLLYGVSTFIDPDRYELFHSGEKDHPGLNIMGYSSSRKTRDIVGKDVVDVPKVDKLLETGRGRTDIETRKRAYDEFQEIVNIDTPVVFLYHPTFNYIVNQRVHGIDLRDVNSIEERFTVIEKWEIVI